MYICLCLLLILPPVECDDKFEINETVYIEKGATSVDVSCGEVPQSAMAIEWSIYKSNEWRKLIKFYHTTPGTRHYFNESTKYDISEFVNTSLVVKNIKLSDSALFKCGSTGKSIHERYILLQVVGKLSLIHLLTAFTFVRIKMSKLWLIKISRILSGIYNSQKPKYSHMCSEN